MITYLKLKQNFPTRRVWMGYEKGYEMLVLEEFCIGTKQCWSLSAKLESLLQLRDVCVSNKSNTETIFQKMGVFQIWCFSGLLSITPFFPQSFTNLCNHSITYSRLHSVVLWTFYSLLRLMSLIAKASKESQISSIEKIIGYY